MAGQAISPEDRDYLIRTIALEAEGEPLEGQAAVASVILNRADKSGASVKDTVLAPGQFQGWTDRADRAKALTPDDPSYQRAAAAVEMAMGSDATGGAVNFLAPKGMSGGPETWPAWAQGDGMDIGGHRFFGGGTGATPLGGMNAPSGGLGSAPVAAPSPFGAGGGFGQAMQPPAPQSAPAPVPGAAAGPSGAMPGGGGLLDINAIMQMMQSEKESERKRAMWMIPTMLGAGLLGGRNWGEGISQGLLGANQAVAGMKGSGGDWRDMLALAQFQRQGAADERAAGKEAKAEAQEAQQLEFVKRAVVGLPPEAQAAALADPAGAASLLLKQSFPDASDPYLTVNGQVLDKSTLKVLFDGRDPKAAEAPKSRDIIRGDQTVTQEEVDGQ